MLECARIQAIKNIYKIKPYALLCLRALFNDEFIYDAMMLHTLEGALDRGLGLKGLEYDYLKANGRGILKFSNEELLIFIKIRIGNNQSFNLMYNT